MTNPFNDNQIEKTLSEIVKNLEYRWGLTLVSFLPADIKNEIHQIQVRLSNLCTDQNDPGLRGGRTTFSFYNFENCHCTHFTITRSDPKGPVRKKAIVKNDRSLIELLHIMKQATANIGPMTIEMNRICLSRDMLGIVLTGHCKDEQSIEYRCKLLNELNKSLPEVLNVYTRSWDRDPAQFSKIHCAIAYIKRPPPNEFSAFQQQINQIEFNPIQFTIKDIDIVHHSRRSLAFPQEGRVTFRLGRKFLAIDEMEFIHRLNLS